MMPNTVSCYPDRLIYPSFMVWMQFKGEQQRCDCKTHYRVSYIRSEWMHRLPFHAFNKKEVFISTTDATKLRTQVLNSGTVVHSLETHD